MRISRRFKRIVSAMLATALAFTMTFSTDVMPLADSKQDQLKAEVSAKQAELDKVNAALKEAQSNKENAEAIKSQLEEQKNLILSQISLLSDQITDLQEQIYLKQTEIDDKQVEVDNKQAEYDQRWSDFKQRMGAMQMLNDGVFHRTAVQRHQPVPAANLCSDAGANQQQGSIHLPGFGEPARRFGEPAHRAGKC